MGADGSLWWATRWQRGGLVAAGARGGRLPPDLCGNLNRIRQVATCRVAEWKGNKQQPGVAGELCIEVGVQLLLLLLLMHHSTIIAVQLALCNAAACKI